MNNRLLAVVCFFLGALFSLSAYADPFLITASTPASNIVPVTVIAGKKVMISWARNGIAVSPCEAMWSSTYVVDAPPTNGSASKDKLYHPYPGCSSTEFDDALYYTARPVTSQTTDTLTVRWVPNRYTQGPKITFLITIRPIDAAKNKGKATCPNCSAGNPINGATGNKYQAETDFVGDPSTSLDLRRFYNSLDENVSGFGAKWTSNWHRKLIVSADGGSVVALRADGREETFRKDATNAWVSDPDVLTRLSAANNGWQIVTATDETEDYAPDGRLRQVTTRAGLITILTYDASNRLSQVANPFGQKLTFSYDASNRISQMTASDGQIYRYGYDANNNLVTVGYPDGKNRSYVYENVAVPNALTGIIDENGARFATFSYSSDNMALSTEHAGGVEKTSFAYNADNTTTVTTPLGATRTHAFATQYGMTKPSAVSGAAVTDTWGKAFAYDANGFLSSRTDWKGNVVTYAHDARGNETSRTEGYGSSAARTITTRWHNSFHLPMNRLEPGRVFDYIYDAKGNLLSRTVTAGTLVRKYSYTYNAFGQVLTATDPAGNVTTYSYDPRGNLGSVTNALGQVTRYVGYDAAGRLTGVADPNGVVTQLTYDARGRLIQVKADATGASPATTTIQYDGVGQITKIIQPNNAFEAFAYDAAHRLTTVTNAVGETINYTRNANSDVVAVSMKRADGTVAYSRTQDYDQLGRLIKSIGAGSQSYQFAYDNNDNLIKVTDPSANSRQYGYDALDRLVAEADEEGKTAILTRNQIDAVTSYTDARGLVTSWGRNGFGEATGETSPDRGSLAYARDARGLVTTRTDARGVTTSYAYDNAGRLTNVTYPGQSGYWKQFIWDSSTANTGASVNGAGRLIAMYGGEGSTWFYHDARGRIITLARANNPAPNGLFTRYSYDAADNVTRMVYPSGRIVTYARDAMGRVSGVTTQQNAAAATQTVLSGVQWNPYGPLAQMSFGYGGVATFTTDTDYRITRYQVGSAANPGLTIDRSLSWMGDTVTSIVDNRNPGTTAGQYGSQSQSFTYTATRRLASARGYYGSLGWTYDSNGNRLTETANGVTSTYAYPAGSNRLASVTPAGLSARSFAYDASGDIVTDSRTGALGLVFGYDPEGRLERIKLPNGSTTAIYRYDPLDHLVSRQLASTGATTLYIHDTKDHIIAETDTAGVTKREYIWLDDLPVAAVDKADTATPALHYVHTDHLGRPARMMAQNGAPVWDVIYAPFGGTSFLWDATAKLDMRFPGQWFQLESGLAYNWHRHYDATLGRYVQPDPIGYAGGRNLYGYVGGNPLAYRDPRGLAIGDYPPAPPGYDAATWEQGQWPNGRDWVRDPQQNTYTVHPEDEGHWRHWDKRDSDNNDQGQCPPNSGKPRQNQKNLKENQSTTDPNGDAPPWKPTNTKTLVPPVVPEYPIPIPELPPLIRIPIPVIP